MEKQGVKRDGRLSLRYWEWAGEAMDNKPDEERLAELAAKSEVYLKALEEMAVSLGIAVFTREEQRAVYARAQYFWNQMILHWRDQFLRKERPDQQGKRQCGQNSFLYKMDIL